MSGPGTSPASRERRPTDSHRLLVAVAAFGVEEHRVYWCDSQATAEELADTERVMGGDKAFHVTGGWASSPLGSPPLRYHTVEGADAPGQWQCLTCHEVRPYESPRQHEERTAYRPPSAEELRTP